MRNFKKSYTGTIQFDAKFIGMRKEQNFIVYPIDRQTNIIRIQSESRWAEINTQTGKTNITSGQSGHHNNMMLAMQQMMGKAKSFVMDPDQLDELKSHINNSSGKSVGNSVITTDNSYAHLI